MPFGQDELIEALLGVNKNLVLVLLSGNAVEMPWVSQVPAIVQGWYLGSMGGKSLADILSGAVNPSGKLPFSFPARLKDCGAHAFDELSYPGDSIKQEYKEDILVGYRWHDTKKIPALFPLRSWLELYYLYIWQAGGFCQGHGCRRYADADGCREEYG